MSGSNSEDAVAKVDGSSPEDAITKVNVGGDNTKRMALEVRVGMVLSLSTEESPPSSS